MHSRSSYVLRQITKMSMWAKKLGFGYLMENCSALTLTTRVEKLHLQILPMVRKLRVLRLKTTGRVVVSHQWRPFWGSRGYEV